ncbi:MAG TPA: tetratricopeptide repeat protein, partial [Elusimicrobiales bacterium]|nr:tetratricopeptide repeat protein [Elusimicrobiales bacterium]
MAKNIYFLSLLLLFTAVPAGASADGYRLYLSGRLTDSARAYQDAFEADPSSVKPLLDAAIVLKQLGRGGRAAELLEKAAMKKPGDPDILCEAGWLHFHEASYDKAVYFFERALKLRPDHSRSVLGMASVRSHLGDRAGTMRLLSRYRELRPDFSGVDYIIAWNYVNFRMYAEAEEKLIEVLRQDPSFVEARLPLAGIYARQKKFDEAWNQYYRVLDYAPGHPIAAENIKILEGKLTKQPEDIRPPFRITAPTRVEHVDAVQALEKSVKLKVGLGTDNTGKQGRNNILQLRSFEGFTITGRASGKLYATVPAGESWTALFENNRIVIKDPEGTAYGRFTGPVMLESTDRRTGSVIIEAVRRSNNPYFRYSDRQYRGALELYPMPGRGIGVRNHIDMELYLLGVVPAEVSP